MPRDLNYVQFHLYIDNREVGGIGNGDSVST